MSIDSYAVCPCGSGKKIKFCTKCKDSVSDLDEILKMIEGGQVVPALDRLSSVLQDHPDAAWALAVRGRLLLDLREYESLGENAERFIRLQPSNPLALTQRAAAKLFRGEVETATESMLEALTESGKEVDSFVLSVASVLAFSLAQQGTFLTARVYATLAMMTAGYEGGQTAVQVLKELNSAPTVNQLFKAIPARIERPSGVDWGERYDEASTLLHSNKIDLAESKFQSLQKTVSGEPAILSGLLTCAIWRGDVDAQADLLKKLSDCESVDFEQRARFRAIAAMVNPQSQETSIEVAKLSADVDNVDEVQMAMASSSRFAELPAEMLAEMKTSDDDIPPRSGFQLLDRDKPESLESLPPVAEVPEATALVFVYGKQTDREARIELLDVRQDNVDDVRQQMKAVVGDLNFSEEAGDPMPILIAAQPAIAMIRFHAKPAEAEALQNELSEARMPDVIANLHVPLLDGESLVSAADDDSKLLQRTALVRIVEQYDSLASKGDAILDRIYELAKLEKLPPLKPSSSEVESVANEDLYRLDPTELDADSLIYLLQRSQQVSATRATRRLARKLIETELSDEQKPAKLLAYMSLINSATQTGEALTMMDEAKAFADANDIPTANLLLSEVGLRLSAGDAEGFQNVIQTLSTRYGNEPEVMARLQQLLVAYGLVNPDGSPRGGPGLGPEPAAAPAGGAGQLWTPDGGAPTSAPASKSDGGGSKLWVPGMD
jgi:tetratricopeptide (TPR) repeat protein